MLRLPRELYREIVTAAKEGLPEEICGLLGGDDDGNIREVREVYFLENADHSHRHFFLDPKAQLRAVKDMRSKGISPLGCFHSHPESPAFPSHEDKRLAYDSEASYVILSLADKAKPIIRSFRIKDGIVKEEDLELI